MMHESDSTMAVLRARERDDTLLAGQRQVLTLLARSAPFRQTLTALCEVIEARLPRALCSILLLSPETGTLHHGAAPRLPGRYCDAIDGAKIGPSAGSCGTAAYLRRSVIVEDIAADPLWAAYKDVALPCSLRACASTPILDSDGAVLGTFAIYHVEAGPFESRELGVLLDFTELATIVIQTERRRAELAGAEAALRQRQKLDSLGVLAGGIAHDFNNLLTIMLSNVGLARLQMPASSPALPYMNDVETTVLRASDLTRQLLAYSGKGRVAVEVTDLSSVVSGMAKLLSLALPAKVSLDLVLAADLPLIDADPAQLQQVVMNLITNAAEAIGPLEGTVHIATRVAELSGASMGGLLPEAPAPGSHVELEVSDTGCGMTPEIMARIFDPFFTTKQTGRGLGLSAMLGILRSHHAGLRVRSKVGEGSTFQVFFPVSSRTPARVEPQPKGPSAPPGRGLALVVDDEPAIRASLAGLMRVLGFDVDTASDGVEALERVEVHGASLSVVLMDLTMPRMGGVEALAELRKRAPDLPVILCSGYSEEHVASDLMPEDLVHFLQKPYSLEDLERALVTVRRTRV